MTREEKNKVFDTLNAGDFRTKAGLRYKVDGRLLSFPIVTDETGKRENFTWAALQRFSRGEGKPCMD